MARTVRARLRPVSDRASAPALVIATGVAVLLLASAGSPPWGLFHDELYYWACSRRPGLGYVDFPPLSAWLLTATQPLIGDGVLGFRLLPALCIGATVVLTAAMAGWFGAGAFGRAVAALAIATAPFHLVFGGFYSTNPIEILLWTLLCALVVTVIRTGDPRWWLAVGLVAGVALLNKHTVVLLLAGIAAGVVATPLLPVLSPDVTRAYFERIDERPEIEAADVGQLLPVHLNGRLEWERLAADVAAAVEALPAEVRARSVVLTSHWVYASVVEYYGRDRDLPPVVSPHNAYYFWRDDARGRDVVVAVGIDRSVLDRDFGETSLLGTFRCRHCTRWRPDAPIHLSRLPRRPLVDLLEEWRHFGIDPAPVLRGPARDPSA